MSWRRGLLLAGIHLAITAPLLVWQEARWWRYTQAANSPPTSTRLVRVAFQEGAVTISLNPCEWFDIGYSRSIEVAGLANLPVAILTDWHDSCLVRTRLGRAAGTVFGTRNHRAEIARCVALCACVFVQWTLVGGFPLMGERRRWIEPGAFITLCAIVGVLLSILPVVYSFARIPGSLAVLAWLWWLGLLVWRTFQVTRRAISSRTSERIV